MAEETPGRPASSNVRGAEYPRVDSERRVTFRVKAPNATKVQVQPGGDDNGLDEWQTWRRSLHDFAPRLFRD